LKAYSRSAGQKNSAPHYRNRRSITVFT